jgi:hypothetical protein
MEDIVKRLCEGPKYKSPDDYNLMREAAGEIMELRTLLGAVLLETRERLAESLWLEDDPLVKRAKAALRR